MDDAVTRFLYTITPPNTYTEISTLTHILTQTIETVPHLLTTYPNENLYVLGGVSVEKKCPIERKTKNEDIRVKNYVFFDLDIRKVHPDYTDNDIIDMGFEIGTLLASHPIFSTWRYMVFSGNGLHLYYVSEPTPINHEEYARGYERIAHELNALLPVEVDIQCKNAARISRLPYSYNNKNNRHSLVYVIEEQQGVISPLLPTMLSKGKRDRVSVDDIKAYITTTPFGDLCRMFGIQVTPKGEIVMQGEVTSAKISKAGNYVNRFSGKGGSGDFIALYMEVYGTQFIETCTILADRIFKKDLGLTEQDEKRAVNETIKKARQVRLEPGMEPLIWNTPSMTMQFPPIKPYSYIIVAGETKSGKSTFAFDLAIKNAEFGKKALYFTLEMTADQLINNIARTAAAITPYEERHFMKYGEYPGEGHAVFMAKKHHITSLDTLYCVGREYGDTYTIHNIIEVILTYPDIDLVVIDNLDKIDGIGKQDDLARQKYISSTITYFTNEYNIPTILVHHLRKRGGERDTALFRGTDALSGTSKLSHDADMLLYVARERDPDGIPIGDDTWIQIKETREFSNITKRIILKQGTFIDVT